MCCTLCPSLNSICLTMPSKILKFLSIVLIGLTGVKDTSGDDFLDQLAALQASLTEATKDLTIQMETVTKLTAQISELLQTFLNPPKVVLPCGLLKNGKQYYLRSVVGSRYVVVDGNQWGLMKVNSQTGAARFTVVEKGCNVYALSVNGMFMSRCEGCKPRTGDYQTVKFHATDSTQLWSHWTITNKEGIASGPYNLRSDLGQYFLTFKRVPRPTDRRAPKEPDQLTLSNVVDFESWFEFEEVPSNCGILQNGDQYYIQGGDGRYAVVDETSRLAYMKKMHIEDAQRFKVTEYACGYYRFCSRGLCMSRCEECKSPTGDFNSVIFHLSDLEGDYSHWAVSLTGRPKPYKYYLNVKDMANPKGYLSFKLNPEGDYQVTIATNATLTTTMFDLIPAVV